MLDGKHNATFANIGGHLIELELAAENSDAAPAVHPDEVAVLRLEVSSDENAEQEDQQLCVFPECCTFYIQKANAEDRLETGGLPISGMLECSRHSFLCYK